MRYQIELCGKGAEEGEEKTENKGGTEKPEENNDQTMESKRERFG